MKISKKKIVNWGMSMILFSLLSGCGAGGSGSAGQTSGSTGTPLASVNLSWSAPNTNTNGTALSSLAGYKIYMGTTPGKLIFLADVGNTNSYTVTGLPLNKVFYFAVTAYDSEGSESAPSNLITG